MLPLDHESIHFPKISNLHSISLKNHIHSLSKLKSRYVEVTDGFLEETDVDIYFYYNICDIF